MATKPGQKKATATTERPLQPRNRNVDRTRVHLELLKRRLEGGVPATPEAYARAIEQWQLLPGAVVRVHVTDLTRAQVASTRTEASEAAQAPTGKAPGREDRP